jgi:DNA-binding NarL/FixJ family response regulator
VSAVTPSPLRVLVADDEPMVREGLRALLSAHDITVVAETGDGREAVDLAVGERPDVAIVDCRMPGLDGITAALHITTFAPEVAVLLHTAHSDADLVAAAQAAGAFGFLWKGTSGDEIVAAVRAAAEHEPASEDGDDDQPAGWVERLDS